MTPYQSIYRRFLMKIEDINLMKLEEADRQALLLELLNTALSYIQFEGLGTAHDLNRKDDALEQFEEDLLNFEIEGIALFMMAAWYEPIVNSLEHTTLFFGSKDEKWSGQKDHWKQTMETQERYRKLAKKQFISYQFRNNAYLETTTE